MTGLENNLITAGAVRNTIYGLVVLALIPAGMQGQNVPGLDFGAFPDFGIGIELTETEPCNKTAYLCFN